MNIFEKIIGREIDNTRRLGCPAVNKDARKEYFAAMTGGRGFRQPSANGVKTNRNGRTRREDREEFLAVWLAGDPWNQPQPKKYRNAQASSEAAAE